MKLITAVIGKKDLNPVCDALREAGYSFTKIPTSGGFLRSSNMTLLIGVDDDKLAHAVELINSNCKTRTEQAEACLGAGAGAGSSTGLAFLV